MLIRFVSNREQSIIVGIFLTVVLFLSSVLHTLFYQHYMNYSFYSGTRIRNSLMSLIYKKVNQFGLSLLKKKEQKYLFLKQSLLLSTESKQKTTSGEIMNLIQLNAESFVKATSFLHMVYGAAIETILVIIFLWFYIGVAAFVGLGTMIVLGPLNSFFTTKFSNAESKKYEKKDERIKKLNEILNGMKVC